MRFVDSNVFIYVLVKSPRDDYVIAKMDFKGSRRAKRQSQIRLRLR